MELKIAHEKFINHLKNEGRSPSTLLAYGKDVIQLTDFLERSNIKKVGEIKLDHLEKFMSKLANNSYTPKSISRKTNSTKTFFKFLKKNRYIEINVADNLKHPKVEIKPPRILSKLEYRALRDTAKEDGRTYTVIEVLLQTGVTISELSEMKLAHIKQDNLFVPAKNNKQTRNIPLNKAVFDAINNYVTNVRPEIETAEHLFITKTGNPLLIRNIRSTITRFFHNAGVENAKVNDLRHTFVAHHLMRGMNLLHLSKIAGHKRVSTTERYLEYIEVETKEEKTELSVL